MSVRVPGDEQAWARGKRCLVMSNLVATVGASL